jgi:hypothetical protein
VRSFFVRAFRVHTEAPFLFDMRCNRALVGTTIQVDVFDGDEVMLASVERAANAA